MAKLYFKYGAMGSSKSAQALMTKFNYEEKDRTVWLIKPSVDTRDGADTVYSRVGLSAKAQAISPQDDIYEMFCEKCRNADVVISDESQFFTPRQADQLFLVTVDLGIPVICYGLRADFMMRGFPGSTRLLELAHTIEELKTICACGRKAICNGRKVNGEYVFEGAQVAIDTVDDVEYQSLCPQCWYREYRAFLARHPKK